MPLLEITQSRQISASVRLDEATATQVDQYAAFIKATADDVVDKALNYVFAKDRDFQDFLKTPEAKQISSTLRVRKAPTRACSCRVIVPSRFLASMTAGSSRCSSAACCCAAARWLAACAASCGLPAPIA